MNLTLMYCGDDLENTLKGNDAYFSSIEKLEYNILSVLRAYYDKNYVASGDALARSFYWRRTIQKHDFWKDVRLKLGEGKTSKEVGLAMRLLSDVIYKDNNFKLEDFV